MKNLVLSFCSFLLPLTSFAAESAICTPVNAPVGATSYKIQIDKNIIATTEQKQNAQPKYWKIDEPSVLYSYFGIEKAEPRGNEQYLDWIRLDISISGLKLNGLKFENIESKHEFNMQIAMGSMSLYFDTSREKSNAMFACKKL